MNRLRIARNLVVPFAQHFAKINAKASDLTLPVSPVEVNVEGDLIVDNGVATDAPTSCSFPDLSQNNFLDLPQDSQGNIHGLIMDDGPSQTARSISRWS